MTRCTLFDIIDVIDPPSRKVGATMCFGEPPWALLT